MKRWLILGLCLPVMATDEMLFFDLDVIPGTSELTVRGEANPLVSYDIIKDDAYDIDRGMVELALDAPFRQTAFLFRTLERNRGAIMGKSRGAPLNIMSFRFELAVRDVTGEELQIDEYEVLLSLAQEPDTGLIQCNTTTHTFSIHDLNGNQPYRQFLKNLVFPDGQKTFDLPQRDAFLVDLCFRWPEVRVDKDDVPIFDLFPSLILWNKGPITRVKVHLGTTYCYRDGDMWSQVQSSHFHLYKKAIDAYTRALNLQNEHQSEEAIRAFEDYLAMVPADQKALARLLDLYMDGEYQTKAYDLIARFQPLFATIRGGLDTHDLLAHRARQERNLLLGRRSAFEKDEDITLKITSPHDQDLVTGTTNLDFVLSGNQSPILQIDCYLDEQLIAKLNGPPFRVPFSADIKQGFLNLRVVAYFENETYQDAQIRVRSLPVDQEQFVNLVALRAVVRQGGSKFLTDLSADDFEILENGEPRKIENFRRDQSPLRIAVLMDTSISMFGKKLYHAQYALATFLSKLEKEDRVSLYTFDHKVLKICDFTNDFEDVSRQVFTLSPQLSTSLYDAILVAHDALLGQNGTKVMIILSDGSDSSSAVTDLHIADLIRNSPVMVYSIILPGDFLGEDNTRGNQFLRELARVSGSISTRVRKVDNLDETFGRIYEELKSFYYMDFYANSRHADLTEIKVKAKPVGAKARYRAWQ